MACLLVVDDEIFNLDIIAEFLSDAGHELVFADDGLHAWQQLDTAPQRFDAIILDRIMPRMDGMEVLHRIKADARFATLPVIMQTAAAEPEQVAEGIAAGAWYYLAKPLSEVALNSIVRAALADRRNRFELAQLSTEIQDLLILMDQAVFRFRTPQQARALAASLARACPSHSTVAFGLAELMLNAVEHGNLGISYEEKTTLVATGDWQDEIERRLAQPHQAERWAQIDVFRTPERLQFTIRDQGPGFDWQRFLNWDPTRAFDSHGRGIALARRLAFTHVDYQGCGNVVIASLDLPNTAAA